MPQKRKNLSLTKCNGVLSTPQKTLYSGKKKRTFECYLEGLWVFKAPFRGVMD